MTKNTQAQTLKILRRPAVNQKTGLSNTRTDELEAKGLFPKRIQISARAIGWIEHEVNEWISQRMAAR